MSLQHPFLKHCVRLRKERAYRQEKQEVLVVGKKIIEQISSHVKPIYILSNKPEKEEIEITSEILAKISGIGLANDSIAIFPLPKVEPFKKHEVLLVLDQVQDPGNLGTLLRTATALGFDGAILTAGTVDPFNDKVIRSSSGCCFLLPLAYHSPEEILALMEEKEIEGYIADLEGTPLSEIKEIDSFLLVLSNEGQGPASWTKNFQKVTIPMHKTIESMNVSSAGSILMYEMVHERL